MKIAKPLVCAGLISVMLVGCGVNDNNDRFANDNDNRPLGVRYNPNVDRDGVNYNQNVNYNTRTGVNNTRAGDGDGINLGLNDNRDEINNRNGVNNNNGNQGRFEVADKASERIVELDGVERANVIVTNRNAYVAARLDDGSRNELTTDLENKIADQVRKVDKDIDNVYVSVNRDFFDRMDTYGNDIRNDRLTDGFFGDFTDTVERTFPTAR